MAIDQGGNLETINTGIVIKADQTALSENFTTVLEQVEVNDKPLFEVQELSEVEANEKLNADDLAGFISLMVHLFRSMWVKQE